MSAASPLILPKVTFAPSLGKKYHKVQTRTEGEKDDVPKMPLETADIQALATALQNLQPNQRPAQVNTTAVKLPLFWQGNPEVWFRQVESLFATCNPAITAQQTKFEFVIQALDNSTAERVQNIILDPP